MVPMTKMGFLKNLNELRKLHKERKMQEIGFVSQNAEPQPDDSGSGPEDLGKNFEAYLDRKSRLA
jgi:hypothetical protein